MKDKGSIRIRLAEWVVALFGVAVGAFALPSWHIAVEGAQLVSGMVQYVSPTVHFYATVHTWSLLHQIGAMALHLGLTERELSLVFSGFCGLLAFAGLFTFSKAVTGRAFLSGLSLFFVCTKLDSIMGVRYMIHLLGWSETYGVVGLNSAILSLGFLGCGYSRLGLFFVGLLPALHATWGVWIWGVCIVWFLIDKSMQEKLPHLTWFAFGAALSAASFVVNQTGQPAIPPAVGVSEVLRLVMDHWDKHRVPIVPWDPRMGPAYLTGAFALVALRRRARLSGIYCGVLIVSIFSIVGNFLFWALFPYLTSEVPILGELGRFLIALMPTRFINLAIVLLLPVCLAEMWESKLLRTTSPIFLTAIWLLPHPHYIVAVGTVLLMAVADTFAKMKVGKKQLLLFERISCVALTLNALLWVIHTFSNRQMIPELYSIAQHREGVVLVPPECHLFQAVTRSRILIDPGSIDFLSFMPTLGVATAAIARDVYGVDLRVPPAKVTGGLDDNQIQQNWERRKRADWRALSRRYGFIEVFARGSWSLDLPVLVEGGGWKLYSAASN